MVENPDGITLGQHQEYVDEYDAGLLKSVPRDTSRRKLSVVTEFGEDVWTAYELSWLGLGGKPEVAIAEFRVPSTSPNLIESKSLKYYLNSFNQTVFRGWGHVQEVLEEDLSRTAGGAVRVRLFRLREFAEYRKQAQLLGDCIDSAALQGVNAEVDASVLRKSVGGIPFDGVLYSNLLKSNCPVTGQPDWASIWIHWKGEALMQSSLLEYIISFRRHQDFHESCVERIYADLWTTIQPEDLWVYARFTRRGGLDINPFRSAGPYQVPHIMAERQ